MVAMLQPVPETRVDEQEAGSAAPRPNSSDWDANRREETIARHMPLVRFVAGSMARHSNSSSVIDYDDLVGYGCEGLIAAVDTFNPAFNVRFSTWAVMHIRTTIQDALRSLDPLPRSLRAKSKQIDRVSQDLANRIGYWPSPDEIAIELGMPVDKLRVTMRDINKTLVSLDSVEDSGGDDTSYSWLSALADPSSEGNPEATLDTSATSYALSEAVDLLPEREATIIRLYYQRNTSMRSIADQLGVSESRVSQIHARALKMLRDTMTTSFPETCVA